MIAVILFFVVIVVAAILLGNWATKLDKKEKELNKREKELNTKDRVREALFAQLCAKEESARKKQKDADDAWEKCLAEGDRLYKKKRELDAKEEELIGVEAKLFAKAKSDQKRLDEAWKKVQEKALMGIPDAPDVIEPVEEPQKVAFGTAEKKRCPRCGKDMEMKTDVCYTTNPPQYKYICPECGYEEVDTCPPTHNLVGTDKKSVKKAKKGGKK